MILVLVAACGRIGFDAGGIDAAGAGDDGGDARIAAAPPAFVQTASSSADGQRMGSATLGQNVTAGDLILVAVDVGPGTFALSSVTDNRGDAFTILGPFVGTGLDEYVAYAYAAGGQTTVTTTLDAAGTDFHAVRVHEYANVAPADPIEASATATGTTNVADGARSAPLTTTEPNELIFGVVTCGAAPATQGTMFQRRSQFDGDITEDMVAATPGAYQATGTCDGNAWNATGVALRGR